ncbi:helix-turn-helix domain-containing protein [Aurantimonas sp. DM33-3]|uniref:helix-turn-helix domain-containing protein n=1 Tax=Aurantimonas sp. DM33-3 TaxID=2766955 RepID=UPI001651BAB8|nr:helix-turn-helix domain-containing protein [Aurantimonas sp. DM33-3]MBC6714704.1 helix-turn-helix domain-containing protein [Aurantimonas sp. DM33-3]
MSRRAAPTPEKADESKELASFTGWKLDLCRAVRADHKVTPGAASLFAAFMDFVNAKTKKAWPSEGSLALALGVSVPTIRKYLAILIEAKWLKRCAEKSGKGTAIYEVHDHRMNTVLDQLAIDLDRLRERQAARKAMRREASRRSDVSKHGFRPDPPMSRNTGLELSHNTGLDEHLHRTPSSQNSTERGGRSLDASENEYLKASRGW